MKSQLVTGHVASRETQTQGVCLLALGAWDDSEWGQSYKNNIHTKQPYSQ